MTDMCLINVEFLLKTEPETYSFDSLIREGRTSWTGVRNALAQKNLRLMKLGQKVFIYHSGYKPTIVGIAEVVKEAYPEPGAEAWSVVDVRPVKRLNRPVTLSQLRLIPEIANWGLLRQSRLSVVPVSPQECSCVLTLAAEISERGA
jgi:predicted RNA-binding protein with PUA-like domain